MSAAERISKPGIYEMSPEQYHADCCVQPSLSRSIAFALVRQTPRHAHYQHPRLGGNGGMVATRAMDDGSAVHSLVLGRGQDIEPLAAVYGPKHKHAGKPVTDFKTKEAEEERDAIRESGRIPMLVHRVPGIQACAAAALEQIREHEDGAAFFAPGRSEAVVVWEEDGIWLRCMLDRLPDDPRASPYDVKATEMSAAPGEWDRRLRTIYAFQDAFYRRGLKAVRHVMPAPMRYPVVELRAPYCLSMMAAAPSLQALAAAEVEQAIATWRQCMKADVWPRYPRRTCHVDAKPWQVADAIEQEARNALEYAA